MSQALKHQAAATVLALLGLAIAASPTAAQSFVKVTDASNPVVGALTKAYAGVSWVDYDADGDDDLFVSFTGLFRNDGAGTFVLIPNALAFQGAATANSWADIDNDGDLDAFVAGGLVTTPIGPGAGSAMYRNNGGVFTKLTAGAIGDTLANASWGCAFGDYDRDGLVDLVTAVANGFAGLNAPNKLFHNLGGASFARVDTAAMCLSLAPYTNACWSDYDGDGDVDCFLAAGPTSSTARDFLYTNRNEAAPAWFQRINTNPLGTDPQDGQMYSWVDYDNDGDLDAYLTNYNGTVANRLYRNEGGGVFTRITSVGTIVTENLQSLSAVWADYDNDADLDCVVTNDGSGTTRLYRNDNGFFNSITIPDLTVTGPRWGASSADYDADGDMDLYATGGPGKPGLFLNTSPSTNAWLEVTLRGTLSNRAAIGAKVRVRARVGAVPRWQMREISAQNTFGGMNSLTAHFGLADASVVDSLVIEWPSGMRTVHTAVAPRQRMTVFEDGPTPALVALASAEAVAEGVALHWILNGSWDPGVVIERCTGSGAWRPWITLEQTAGGDLRALDRSVEPGGRYGYRLRVREAAREQLLGEVWTEVPGATPAPATRIRAIRPNPSTGQLEVELALVPGRPARLEVFDVSGRRVGAAAIEAPGAGTHTQRFGDDHPLPAGVYVLRLTQGERSHASRAVVRE